MKRFASVLAAFAVISGASLPVTAFASPNRSGPKSFIDTDRDGRFTAGKDQKFPAPIAPGVLYVNHTTGAPADVVVGGDLPNIVFVMTNGAIHVTGNVSGQLVHLDAEGGDLVVDPGVHINASRYAVTLLAMQGTVSLGAGASVRAGGGGGIDLDGAAVSLGDGVSVATTGEFGRIAIVAPTVQFGDHVRVAASVNGRSQATTTSVRTCSDIVMRHGDVEGQWISLDARSGACERGGRVAVTNGLIKLDADETAHLTLNGTSVDLTGTTVSPSSALH